MESDSILNNFIKVIGAEIECIKKRGTTNVFVRDGKYIGQALNKHRYQFRLEALSSVPDDTMIELEVEKKRVKGSVLGCDGGEIFLALDEFIGDPISKAKIITAPYFLLELMQKKFEEINEGTLKIDQKLARKLFNMQKVEVGFQDFSDFSPLAYLPNEMQVKAVSLALGSEVSFIWGPPGTGKTKTLARIAEAMIAQKHRVLIAAHTNVAVDRALLDVIEVTKNQPEFYEGKFIRYGVPQEPRLEEVSEVNIRKVAEKKASPLIKERNELESKKTALTLELNNIEGITKEIGEYEGLSTQLDRMRTNMSKLQGVEDGHKKEMQSQLSEIDQIKEKIVKYSNSNKFLQFFSGINVEKLKGEEQRLEYKVSNLKSAISENAKKFNELKVEGLGLRQRQEELSAYFLKKGVDVEGVKTRQTVIYKELPDLNSRIDKLEKEIQKIELLVLSEARLVATTLTKTYTSLELLTQKFDVLIVDEASMVQLPLLYLNACFVEKKVVVIGDFCQLPPIASSREHSVERWLKRDIFVENEIPKRIENKKGVPNLVMLQRQYRMHPTIMDVSNEFIYGRSIVNDETTNSIGVEIVVQNPAPGKHIAFYDTYEIKPWCSRLDNWSRFNIYNASLAIKLAFEALENGVKPSEVGIIAPYKAQINLIQKLLLEKEEVFPGAGHIYINTVHKFQGSERQVIIFDTVDGPPLRPGKLIDDRMPEGDDERLINVALTRAQKKLIIIGDSRYIQDEHSGSSLLKKILNYLKQKGNLVDASNIMTYFNALGFEEALEILERSNFKIDQSKSSIYNQKSFYPAYFNDLLSAKITVVILSPFIAENRLNKLGDIFKRLISIGVQLIIFMRPASRQPGGKQKAEELINALTEMGAIVSTKNRDMHEKVSIIDNSIAWAGSLNILSQNKSSELMYRLTGKGAADELLKNFNINKQLDQLKLEKDLNETCDVCGKKMVIKTSAYGPFLSCSGYPSCKYTKKIKMHKIIGSKDKVEVCENCGIEMKIRKGRRGMFWGCPNYPECKNTKNIL